MRRLIGVRWLLTCSIGFVVFSIRSVHSQSSPDKEKLRRAHEAAAKVDSLLRFKKKEIAPVASDGEFLRRLTLDLTGSIPASVEVRAFLDDPSPSKRKDAIERLLASESFADHWSRIWCQALLGNYYDLRSYPGGKQVVGDVMRKSFREFEKWVRDKISTDTPWQAIVAELITATGKITENPPVLFKAAYFRDDAHYLNLADSMSRALLGMRISCARCHDHPFDRWTQEDYYGLAAFFYRVRGMPIGGSKDNECDDGEFTESKDGELMMPGTERPIQPVFLYGGKASTSDMRLPALGVFLVSRENVQLLRNVVNRTWAWLMGRGFVEPVDDFNQQNRPVQSQVMEHLTREFGRSGGSLRHLVRIVCNSEAYQRSSAEGGEEPFTGAAVRQLTGEQLFKSLVTASLGSKKGPNFQSKEFRELWNRFRGDQLGPIFPPGQPWTEVTLLPGNTRQNLMLRNSPFVDGLLNHHESLAAVVSESEGAVPDKIDRIFLAVLTRLPAAEERDRFALYVSSQTSKRPAFEDVVWTLLNSAEFSTRH